MLTKDLFVLYVSGNSVVGHTLNITKINRDHMGQYQCVADNGVPPAANQTFQVEVHCKYAATLFQSLDASLMLLVIQLCF